MARLTLSALAFDIASCTLQADEGFWLRFLPLGEFRAQDGRPKECRSWRLTEAGGQQIAADLNAKKTPIVIDYEHQTLHAETNGMPAPAAGWCTPGKWEMRADGLYALVTWTPAAAKRIQDGEYRFFSPVFGYKRQDGEVTYVMHGAITNAPALDGFSEVFSRAAAKLTPEDTDMKYTKLLLAILGLKAEATEDEVMAALTTLDARLKKEAGDGAASCNVSTVLDGLNTAVAAAKAQAEKPDPTKFMPMEAAAALQSQVSSLQAEVVALRKAGTDTEADALIAAALKDGRLVASTEAWARDYAKKDLAGLKAYLQAAHPITALTQTQTDGQQPKPKQGELSADEKAMCKHMGISEEAYLKTRTADQAASA